MSSHAGVITGHDDFTGAAVGALLGGRTAPAGGTWATSGATTDFAAAEVANEISDANIAMARSTVSDASGGRYAVLGTATQADTQVSVRVRATANASCAQGVIARWTDSNNYFTATLSPTSPNDAALNIKKRVAGTTSTLVSTGLAPMLVGVWYTLELIVFASGLAKCEVRDAGGATLLREALHDASLATGGALATGTTGIRDEWDGSTAVTRYYDNFTQAVPSAEPIALHSGQSIEFRHDSVLREDASGTYAGPPPEYVGSRFFIPPAGDKGRKTRIAVVARRNDPAIATDDHIADALTITVWATPRYLAVPR